MMISMNPALVLFGIQAVIRLGKIGKDASEQYVRDAEALFPDIRKPQFDRRTYVNGFFGSANYRHFVKGSDAPFKEYWGSNGVINTLNSVDMLFAAAVQIKSEEGIDLNQWLSSSQIIAGATLIEQWDPKKPAPLSPFARVILAAGDIALEFVAINPGLLGVGGNGEKLIGAFAKNLSALLPDDGGFGDHHEFGERLLGVFLRAGLDTISKNPAWVMSEEHVQRLISAAVEPIVKALPNDLTEQIKYREVTDALIGPAASAAMQTLADCSDAFLGQNFGAETAIGALTKALLGQAAKMGLNNQFTKNGLIELYRATLGVAAEKPHLFLNDNSDPPDHLAEDLISNFASVLMRTVPPFDGRVGVQLAAAALEAVSANAHRFAGRDKPWEQTAADMVGKIAEHLGKAFKENKRIENVFSKAQLIELGRIMLNHMASTPEMIIGPEDALAQLLGTVAKAMAKDDKLLLDGDDWLEIVKAAAQEAAANPARLFRLDPNDATQTLAAQVMKTILNSAGRILDEQSLRGKTVLFGKTLREATIMLLQATSGNPDGAQKNLLSIGLLIASLNEFVAKNCDKFGNKEWLDLFRVLLTSVLEGRELDELTVESAKNLLMGKA
jgi:hypothetical protein